MRSASLFLLGTLSLQGCGAKPCAEIASADERDWCWHGQAIELAGQGNLDGAIQALDGIQAPMVRSFATEKILTDPRSGLSQFQAEALCKELVEPYSTSCLRAWSRPHLWSAQ